MIGLSEHIDLALITLYLFWIFFIGLLVYLNRESCREGFPAIDDHRGRSLGEPGLLGLAKPKEFHLPGGDVVLAPRPEPTEDPQNARPVAPFAGAPLIPVGDPMRAGFGPSAWAPRRDEVLTTLHGQPKIAPMRDLKGFEIVKGDRDPRGLPIVAGDGEIAGEVVDVWIDQEEAMIRYLEVNAGGRNILVPMTMAKVGGTLAKLGIWRPEVRVRSIMSDQFAGVPATKSPNTVTLLEEDKITAYFGGGTFFATNDRNLPAL